MHASDLGPRPLVLGQAWPRTSASGLGPNLVDRELILDLDSVLTSSRLNWPMGQLGGLPLVDCLDTYDRVEDQVRDEVILV